jgi:hypothetical protein
MLHHRVALSRKGTDPLPRYKKYCRKIKYLQLECGRLLKLGCI